MKAYWLAKRSVLRTLRRPQVFLPAFVMAVLGLLFNVGSLGAADTMPGFPAANFVSYTLATTVMMGVLFIPLLAGGDMAQDVQSGFLNRLALLPLSRITILISNLAGTALIGLFLGAALLLTGLFMASSFEAGPWGVPVFLLLIMLTSVALGSLGNLLALHTGSTQAITGVFGLSFALIFFSTGQIPREFIVEDWFLIIADLNPLSHLIAGVRSLIIDGWDFSALAIAFGIVFVILFLCTAAGQQVLKERLSQ